MYLTDAHLQELYAAHSEELFLFLRSRTGNAQDALDLVGETYSQATLSRTKCKADTLDGARAWLFGIANNLLKGFFKRKYVESRAMQRLRLERVCVHEPVLPLEPENDTKREITAWLDKIKPEYSEAVSRRIIFDQSYAKIASDLNISEELARKRVSRGMMQLRSLATTRPRTEPVKHG